jgi:integrase
VPRFPHRARKTKPLSPEEADLIMRFSPQPYKWFFQVSILTGLRTGEALGLRWEDFDLRKRVIYIRRTLTGGKISAPKTLAGEREIPLFRPVWEIYEKRRRANLRNCEWFFYSTYRGVLSLAAIRRTWKAFLSAFEMEPRPLYATRHTFASLAVAAGEDPLWIAQVMGHARPDQLLLRYASYLEGVKNDGEKFLNLLIGKPSFMRVVD